MLLCHQDEYIFPLHFIYSTVFSTAKSSISTHLFYLDSHFAKYKSFICISSTKMTRKGSQSMSKSQHWSPFPSLVGGTHPHCWDGLGGAAARGTHHPLQLPLLSCQSAAGGGLGRQSTMNIVNQYRKQVSLFS